MSLKLIESGIQILPVLVLEGNGAAKVGVTLGDGVFGLDFRKLLKIKRKLEIIYFHCLQKQGICFGMRFFAEKLMMILFYISFSPFWGFLQG